MKKITYAVQWKNGDNKKWNDRAICKSSVGALEELGEFKSIYPEYFTRIIRRTLTEEIIEEKKQ